MSQHHRLYCTAAWRRLRVAQLTAKPLCRMCEELGQFVIATIVDHVRPHRGDLALFHDETNLQSLCKPCHDSHKQAQEHSVDGIMRGASRDGLPLDLSHPFYRPARREIPRSCASTVQTSADLSSVSIAPPRAHGAPGRANAGVQGAHEKRRVFATSVAFTDSGTGLVPSGGGESRTPTGSQTAYVPSFATCQNSKGGV